MNADALLRADQQRIARIEPDHVFNLLANSLRLGGGQVDLINYRNNFQIMVQREISIRERLRFHALRSVHHQQRAFARLQTARNFVGKIHVARRIDQIELIPVAVVGLVIEPHRVRFDGDAALAFQIHRVEHLRHHFTLRKGPGGLQKPVRQRGSGPHRAAHLRGRLRSQVAAFSRPVFESARESVTSWTWRSDRCRSVTTGSAASASSGFAATP